MILIFLYAMWLVTIYLQVSSARRSRSANKQLREQIQRDMFHYIGKRYDYEYGKPFIPKIPVYVEDCEKKVWLNTEVVKVAQNIVLKDDMVNPMDDPIERYFTSEFATMAKLKNEDLQKYF